MDINNLALRARACIKTQKRASPSSVLLLYDRELIVLNDRNPCLGPCATPVENAILGHASAAAITSILSALLAILFQDVPL